MSVAKRVIKMGLSSKSISQAIRELKSFRDSLEAKTKVFLEELAHIGVQEASIRFTTAMYDGVNDSSVTLKPIEGGFCIVAEGKAVAFIEFGAGVYYNPSGPYYPTEKPDWVVGIGEYGKGHGKRKAWGFYDDSGELVITHGTPATMGMWYASQEMRNAIVSKFKEVFG